MFDTYSIVLVIALALSVISLRWHNILFSLGGAVAWLALWRYHQTNPPAGIIVGDTTHEWIMYIYIILAIAVMFTWFAQRRREYTGYPRTGTEERDYQSTVKTPKPRTGGYMDMSEGEYRATIRNKLRRRK